MLAEINRIAIVGASVAGYTAASTLRSEGYRGELHLIGDEPHIAYDRPPLSKELLAGDWGQERLFIATPQSLSDLNVALHLGQRAIQLDLEKKKLYVGDGYEIPFDRILIATGVKVRRLAMLEHAENVHYLRTLDDGMRLANALKGAKHLAVIGAGFVGVEVAASARKLGVQVTLIDQAAAPLSPKLGVEIGSRVAQLHELHGVTLRMSQSVTSVSKQAGSVTALTLGDGSTIRCDRVIVAIGTEPETAWLTTSGLTIDDGIVCDAYCRAADGVYAAGDVARWHHRGYQRSLRVEHRANAIEQAIVASRNILGNTIPYTPLPFFWTKQYDVNIQVFGLIPATANVQLLHGNIEGNQFVAGYFENDVLIGVLGWNAIKATREYVAQLRNT